MTTESRAPRPDSTRTEQARHLSIERRQARVLKRTYGGAL